MPLVAPGPSEPTGALTHYKASYIAKPDPRTHMPTLRIIVSTPRLVCLLQGYLYLREGLLYQRHGSPYQRQRLSLPTTNRYCKRTKIFCIQQERISFYFGLPHLCCSLSLKAARRYLFDVRRVVSPKPSIEPVRTTNIHNLL